LFQFVFFLSDIGEIFGLSEAYGGNRKSPLLIGSVKQNIGHGEAAAAMGSAIKLILALEKEEIPPNIFLTKLNPKINLDVIPGLIPTKLTPWTGDCRLAGLSSFSLTGSLVHAILQSTPQIRGGNFKETEKDGFPHLVTISAKSAVALDAQAENYVNFFRANAALSMADVAYSANVCRTHFSHRIAVVVSSLEELISRLESRDYFRDETKNEPMENSHGAPLHHCLTKSPDAQARKNELVALAEFYVHGGKLDFSDLLEKREKRVVLPFYPFQRQKYWFSPQDFPKVMQNRNEGDSTLRNVHPLLGWKLSSSIGAIFQNENPGLLSKSSTVGEILEILIAAGIHNSVSVCTEVHLEFIKAWTELSGRRIQTVVESLNNGQEEFEIRLYQAKEGKGWEIVASSKLAYVESQKPSISNVKMQFVPIDQWQTEWESFYCSPGALEFSVKMGTNGRDAQDAKIRLPLEIKRCSVWVLKNSQNYLCGGGNGRCLIVNESYEPLVSLIT